MLYGDYLGITFHSSLLRCGMDGIAVGHEAFSLQIKLPSSTEFAPLRYAGLGFKDMTWLVEFGWEGLRCSLNPKPETLHLVVSQKSVWIERDRSPSQALFR